MKEVTETITLNDGQCKTVTLKIDEQIYEALIQTGNRAIYEAYLAEEYNTRCLERRAKDNCTSLDAIAEEGHDFEDETVDVVRDAIRLEQRRFVSELMKSLNDNQRTVISMYFSEGYSMSEIAENLGVSKTRVWQLCHFHRIGDALAYLMKYIEKSGKKIVYSKGLPQFFISDIMDEDVVCSYGGFCALPASGKGCFAKSCFLFPKNLASQSFSGAL